MRKGRTAERSAEPEQSSALERLGEFLTHGSCGAFLAALTAISVMWFVHEINWWFVGIAALFGFLLAGFYGEQALGWLYDVFWWS